MSDYDEGQPPFAPGSLWSMDRPFTFRTRFATDLAIISAGIGLDPGQFDATTGLPH